MRSRVNITVIEGYENAFQGISSAIESVGGHNILDGDRVLIKN